MARKPSPRIGPDLDKITLLLISGISSAAAQTIAVEKFHVKPAAAKRLVNEAERRIVLAANYDRAREVGAALSRLNDCYRRASQNQDVKTCITAQREINRLLDLASPRTPEPPAEPGEDAEGAHAADQLATARAHLVALGLGRPDDPLPELSRLAVAKIIELEAGARE